MPPEKRMFGYLLQLYEAMVKEATPKNKKVYEGKVVTTFQNLNISMAHYTPLFNALKELGCIELIDRGARGRPTRYRLHHPPVEDAYENLYAGGLTDGSKPATVPVAELEQRISNLERRLEGLDIKGMAVNFEERISKMEKAKGGSKR